jgi:hypothetical protein
MPWILVWIFSLAFRDTQTQSSIRMAGNLIADMWLLTSPFVTLFGMWLAVAEATRKKF